MTNTATNMISYFSIAVFMVMFSAFGFTDYDWDDTPDSLDTIHFEYNEDFKLSEDGRVALHELLKAKSYSVSRVGAGGHYSPEYDNFVILIHEDNALSAFKKLVMEGTEPAQVFGLIGLKIKKPELIKNYKSLLTKRDRMIEVHGGCFWSNEKVSSLIYSKRVNYYWLEKNLALRYQWLKQNHKLFTPLVSNNYGSLKNILSQRISLS